MRDNSCLFSDRRFRTILSRVFRIWKIIVKLVFLVVYYY